MRLCTFDQVVQHYERIKPVLSKHHSVKDDVRPIGARNRKWERIKRIDDTTYALLDGNYGHTMWSGNDHEYENTMAPIVWTREADGDYIRIRNHANTSSGSSRYDFLFHNLPRGMAFQAYGDGKQAVSVIVAPGRVEEIPLPKCKVQFDYGTRTMTYDDNVFLKFRVEGNAIFTRVGEKLTVVTGRINLVEKKQWRERIDAFYKYMDVFGPMIKVDWESRRIYCEVITSWCSDNGIQSQRGMWNIHQVEPDVVRQVFTQEDHPLRVAIACLILDYTHAKEGTPDITPTKVRAAYNRLVNKALDLYKSEEV